MRKRGNDLLNSGDQTRDPRGEDNTRAQLLKLRGAQYLIGAEIIDRLDQLLGYQPGGSPSETGL